MCVCSVLLTCVSLRFFTWEVCVCVCVCEGEREREREREKERERERKRERDGYYTRVMGKM